MVKFTSVDVQLLHWTQPSPVIFTPSFADWDDYESLPPRPTPWIPHGDFSREGQYQEVAEFAGRACYESWDRPNPETATIAGYLANILKQKHFSVLEHISVGFYITGVSRSLTHELVRHRHLSYSQLSQRYVDSSDVQFVIPPAYRGNEDATNALAVQAKNAVEAYDVLVQSDLKRGVPRKKAREAARSVLPNMTETRLVVTANLRSWMEFLSKRDNPAADAEIQELARAIRIPLIAVAPDVFNDAGRQIWDEIFAQHAPKLEAA